jgi:cytochrome c5
MAWRWNGGPAVLQSRAFDESGTMQPTRAQFVALRGQTSKPPSVLDFPSQHFNAITSWAVNGQGGVRHVYARLAICLSPPHGLSAPRFAPKDPISASRSVRRTSRPGTSPLCPTATACRGQRHAVQGAPIFAAKCSACHGDKARAALRRRDAGPPRASLDGGKTIANFWPYATTIFDFVRRAMPYNAPHSLRDDEVYALTAYL